MKIDLNHLHHWMRAIRESDDHKRTLDAFWKGQIDSKLWLIENLKPFVVKESSVDIHGGWIGVLASMLFQSDIPITTINNIDIDSSCMSIANNMNQIELEQGRFRFILENMCNIDSVADVVINTSCEHINQEQYNLWLSKVSSHSLLVLQSNNYRIDEHVRISESLDKFEKQSNISVLWKGKLELPLYERYMIIGKKDV
jgi:hypothetical protein